MEKYIIYDKKNNDRLLFVNCEGRLKCLYTPFQVICVLDTGVVKINTVVYVDAIATSSTGKLLYVIHETAHFYYCFCLAAKF